MLTNTFRPGPAFLLIFIFSCFSAIAQSEEESRDKSFVAMVGKEGDVQEEPSKHSDTDDIIRGKKESKVTSTLTKREIYIDKGRTSFRFKYGGRIQTRFDVARVLEPGAEIQHELYFRRVRLKSDGHLFTPRFGYKLEIDIIGAQVLDAYLKWNFYENFEIWGGQTKLRGNRERVISSQNLQFVDRSLLNRQFTLDRDLGVWLFHNFNAGQGIFRQVISVSKGEGLSIWRENPQSIEEGLDYTARVEYLPFGKFRSKGDYVGSDLEREPNPKLSIGLTYDYNENAVKSRGQKGSLTDKNADLRSWIADLMFKYRGFSVMSEFVDRKVHGYNHPTLEQYNDYISDFYTGQAFNIQSGYVFKRNYELAVRYTEVRPQENYIYNNLTEYTFALSKYFIGHKLKAQTDFSILKETGKPITHIYRLQFELSL